jgi:hypothetical protein
LAKIYFHGLEFGFGKVQKFSFLVILDFDSREISVDWRVGCFKRLSKDDRRLMWRRTWQFGYLAAAIESY